MTRPPLSSAIRCHHPACQHVLGYVKVGVEVGRYFVPAPGVVPRPHEDGTAKLTCPECKKPTVLRWGRRVA